MSSEIFVARATPEYIAERRAGWKKARLDGRLSVPVQDLVRFEEDPEHYVASVLSDGLLVDFIRAIANSGKDYSVTDERHMISQNLIYDFFDYMADRHPQVRNFVDLGCGIGFPVALAQRFGFNSVGVENVARVAEKGRAIFEQFGLEKDRIIQGDFLEDRFWMNEYSGVNPREPGLFYLFNRQEAVEIALPIIANQIHKESRVVIGWDAQYDSLREIDRKLSSFNMDLEAYLLCKCLVLKKSER